MILSYMYPIRTGHQTARAKQGAAKAAKHHHKRLKGARGQGGSAEGGGMFRAISARRVGAAGAQAADAGPYAPGRRGGLPSWAHYVHNAPMKAPTFKTGGRFSGGENRHAPLPPPLFKICLIPNQSYTGWSFFMFLTMEPGVVPKLDGQIRFL